MDINIVPRDKDIGPIEVQDALRIELTQIANDGTQYQIMLLDADDSFDVVVTYPNTEREIVWSLAREREGQ